MSSTLDRSQDRADGNSVLRTSFRMGQHEGSVPVEHEITTELASVLTSAERREASLQQGPGVEEDDIRMSVGSQKRRTSQPKDLVGVPLWVQGDLEGQIEPVLKPGGSFFGLERDDDHSRVRPPEFVLLCGHLHEMALADQSPDVAKEGKDYRRTPELRETQLVSI